MKNQPDSIYVDDDMTEPVTEPVKVKYGIVSNDLGYAFICLKFVDTIEEAKELLRDVCNGLGDPISSSDYWAQYNYGQHSEYVSIIENPEKLIEELDNCYDCEQFIQESTDNKLSYYIDDLGDSGMVWDMYITKSRFM